MLGNSNIEKFTKRDKIHMSDILVSERKDILYPNLITFDEIQKDLEEQDLETSLKLY